MSRNIQVSRILRVLHFLEINKNGLSIKVLHQKLIDEGYDASIRTIHRDLEALEDARFPVTNDQKGDESIWKLDKVAIVTQKVSFDYHDLFAFYIAHEQIDSLANTPLHAPLVHMFAKFEKLIGPEVSKARTEFEKFFFVHQRYKWNIKLDSELFNTLHTACEEGEWIEFEYLSANKSENGYRKRKLGPEAIYFADNGAYLVGLDPISNIMKTFSLARMKNLVRLDEVYKSQNIKVEDYFNNSFGILRSGDPVEYEIKVLHPIASYVSERRWHDSQTIEETKEGIILRFKVQRNDEIARWILSLGDHAEVIGPLEVRQDIENLAASIIKLYKTKKAA